MKVVTMKIPNPVAAIVVAIVVGLAHAPAASDTPDSRWEPEPYVKLDHPDWSRDAVLYQINTRQLTVEGTFAAAEKHLPRLADLGVGILWLMPIHPIGEKNRKGTLGSPYSVRDYFKINPELGTLEDFKSFVEKAHTLGMKVILDWVANHTAWDNALVEQHPDWYERDWKDNFRPTPWWDWSDIIDLDFSQAGVREYMARAMKYWVEDVNIDGFRADVAAYIPLDFWEKVRAELDSIKPVFMLGEAEMRDLHMRAFDATYGWSWNNTVHAVAVGKANATALFGFYAENESAWPRDAYRMLYTSNHDQNSWEGTQFERFGDALEAAIVLSFTSEGFPMIYNGQEAGNPKRLAFFEKDPIEWREHPLNDLFAKLIALKKNTPALHNGEAGARMVQVVNSAPEQVFSFVRADDSSAVFVTLNFSGQSQTVKLVDGPAAGKWRDAFGGEQFELARGDELTLPAWGWKVLVAE